MVGILEASGSLLLQSVFMFKILGSSFDFQQSLIDFVVLVLQLDAQSERALLHQTKGRFGTVGVVIGKCSLQLLNWNGYYSGVIDCVSEKLLNTTVTRMVN